MLDHPCFTRHAPSLHAVSNPDVRPGRQRVVIGFGSCATAPRAVVDLLNPRFRVLSGPSEGSSHVISLPPAGGYEALVRATEAGLRTVRPGATCTDVFTAMRREIEDAGFPAGTVGRMGHGLGMQLTEWPSHREGDHTVLVPGMVITLEPALTLYPGHDMVHEENLVVREDGIELLSRRAPETIVELW